LSNSKLGLWRNRASKPGRWTGKILH